MAFTLNGPPTTAQHRFGRQGMNHLRAAGAAGSSCSPATSTHVIQG